MDAEIIQQFSLRDPDSPSRKIGVIRHSADSSLTYINLHVSRTVPRSTVHPVSFSLYWSSPGSRYPGDGSVMVRGPRDVSIPCYDPWTSFSSSLQLLRLRDF